MFDDDAKPYRWFLLPSEASLCLRGGRGVLRACQSPFQPEPYPRATGTHHDSVLYKGNINGRPVTQNSSGDMADYHNDSNCGDTGHMAKDELCDAKVDRNPEGCENCAASESLGKADIRTIQGTSERDSKASASTATAACVPCKSQQLKSSSVETGKQNIAEKHQETEVSNHEHSLSGAGAEVLKDQNKVLELERDRIRPSYSDSLQQETRTMTCDSGTVGQDCSSACDTGRNMTSVTGDVLSSGDNSQTSQTGDSSSVPDQVTGRPKAKSRDSLWKCPPKNIFKPFLQVMLRENSGLH